MHKGSSRKYVLMKNGLYINIFKLMLYFSCLRTCVQDCRIGYNLSSSCDAAVRNEFIISQLRVA